MNIYADNAATTQMSPRAIAAMEVCLKDIYGNPSSLHSVGQKANKVLTEARKTIADCIGADYREIIFTSGGSEADNQVITSFGGQHIISTVIEHHAILNTLKRYRDVTLLGVDENGLIDLAELEKAICSDSKLVSVMFANNEIGTIEPICEIGRICRQKNITFHTDAVQAVGHLPINVNRMNIDLLSASAHKFHGPKGVGFLYVRKDTPINSLINGGGQERGLRAGTENVAGIAAMAEALKESLENIDQKIERTEELRDRLIWGLKEIPDSVLNGDETYRLPGNVNFCFKGVEGEALLLMLDEMGIQASSGSACSSGSNEPSHVLTAIGRERSLAQGSLRLTIDETFTENQIDYIIKSVKQIVEFMSKRR